MGGHTNCIEFPIHFSINFLNVMSSLQLLLTVPLLDQNNLFIYDIMREPNVQSKKKKNENKQNSTSVST